VVLATRWPYRVACSANDLCKPSEHSGVNYIYKLLPEYFMQIGNVQDFRNTVRSPTIVKSFRLNNYAYLYRFVHHNVHGRTCIIILCVHSSVTRTNKNRARTKDRSDAAAWQRTTELPYYIFLTSTISETPSRGPAVIVNELSYYYCANRERVQRIIVDTCIARVYRRFSAFFFFLFFFTEAFVRSLFLSAGVDIKVSTRLTWANATFHIPLCITPNLYPLLPDEVF